MPCLRERYGHFMNCQESVVGPASGRSLVVEPMSPKHRSVVEAKKPPRTPVLPTVRTYQIDGTRQEHQAVKKRNMPEEKRDTWIHQSPALRQVEGARQGTDLGQREGLFLQDLGHLTVQFQECVAGEEQGKKYRPRGYLLKDRSFGRCPSRSLVWGPVPTVSALHARHVPWRVMTSPQPSYLSPPCHRRQRVLMAEGYSEASTLPRIRATARSLDPSGPELSKTRLHTACLTGTEGGQTYLPSGSRNVMPAAFLLVH